MSLRAAQDSIAVDTDLNATVGAVPHWIKSYTIITREFEFSEATGVTGHADGFPNRVTNKTVRRHPAALGQPGHLAGCDIVHSGRDLQLLGVDEFLDNRATLGEACRRQARVCLGDLLHQGIVMRIAMAVLLGQGGECRLKVFEQGRDITELDVVNRALDRAAEVMSQHNNCFGPGNLRRIFEAANNIRVYDIAGHTCAEHVADPLVENQFRRNARIDAADPQAHSQ